MNYKILTIKENENELRKKSKLVINFDIKLVELAKDMASIMDNASGIGLASPQIGIKKQLIIATIKKEITVIINPTITWKSFRKAYGEEGCLSVPGKVGDVLRHRSIKLKYFTLDNKQINVKLREMDARVIQHEIDHLNGILYIDKAKDLRNI